MAHRFGSGVVDLRSGSVDALPAFVRARAGGYATAKARRANGYLNGLLLPSEHARLVEDATGLASAPRLGNRLPDRGPAGTSTRRDEWA